MCAYRYDLQIPFQMASLFAENYPLGRSRFFAAIRAATATWRR